jgi:hypothetical protein
MKRKTMADLLKARAKVKGKPRAYDPNRVMKAQCSTCPYREDGLVIDAATREVYMTDPDTGNQYCHSPAWQGKPEDTICRGHRDHWLAFFVKSGLLSESTDQAWAAMVEICRRSGDL